MPGGDIIGLAFFALLAIAALTSTVSLLEVPVAFLVDEKKWTRKKAVWVITVITFFAGLPSALSQGTVDFLSNFHFLGQTDFLSLMNFLFSDMSLSIGGFFVCVFVGWAWGSRNAVEEIAVGTNERTARMLFGWEFLIKFVCPVIIFAVLLNVFHVF